MYIAYDIAGSETMTEDHIPEDEEVVDGGHPHFVRIQTGTTSTMANTQQVIPSTQEISAEQTQSKAVYQTSMYHANVFCHLCVYFILVAYMLF